MKIEVSPKLIGRLMEFYKKHYNRLPENDDEIMFSVYLLFEYYDGDRQKK